MRFTDFTYLENCVDIYFSTSKIISKTCFPNCILNTFFKMRLPKENLFFDFIFNFLTQVYPKGAMKTLFKIFFFENPCFVSKGTM